MLSTPQDRHQNAAFAFALGGLFLLILAARWLVVEAYSTQVPFWDQWLFEAPLLKAAAEGHTPWLGLAGAANEHRILWTRLLQLSTFWLNNGQWDAQVLLTINAFLAAGVPVVALLALRSSDKAASAPGWILLVMAGVIWLCPVQWYNTLWAIQSIVYLLGICSLGGMALVLRAREGSAAWWGGVALLAAALFCMGSGLLASAAVLGVCLLRGWRGAAWKTVLWTGTAALLVLICGVLLQASAGRIEGLYAASLGNFTNSLYKSMCWPWTLSWTAGAGFPLGILLWLPAPIFLTLIVLRRSRPGLELGAWEVLAAVILWTYAQLVIMAYTRGAAGRPPSWRHYDVHAIGLLANGAALIQLLRPWLATAGGRKWFGAVSCAGLYAALLVAGLLQLSQLALNELEIRKKQNGAQITNLRAFLATGDAAAHLENKPQNQIPWDDPKYLAACLSDPTIRWMLPTALREPERIVGLASFRKDQPPFLQENVSPPFLPPTPFRKIYSTWAIPLKTRVLGEEIQLRKPVFPYLILPYTCDLTGPESETAELNFKVANKWAQLGPKPNHSWGEAVIKVPGNDLKDMGIRIVYVWNDHDETSDGPLAEGWLAIMEPIGAGRFTIWTRAWRAGSNFLLGAAAFLLVAGALLATRTKPDPEGNPKEEGQPPL